jgi:superfamily II DNA/RNA helicase
MLDMGFIPDIERICKLLPVRRQTLFFSATMPTEIKRLVDSFLKDPVRVEVTRPASVVATITQLFKYCPSTEDWQKREVLRELIGSEHVKNAIIFCNRKRDVAILLKSLLKHGFNAGALHGDMDQMSRMATLDAFREGRITLLAASDVAARGLDIPDVSHIFNFDVPWQSDDYVHRIGRTGRAGKEGRSLTLVTPDDTLRLTDIERMLGAPVTWIGDPPSAEDMENGKRRRGRGRGGRPGRPTGRGHEARRGDRPQRSGAPPRNGAHHHAEQPSNGAARPNGNGEQEHAPPARAKTSEPRPPRERSEHREARQPRERSEPRPPRERGERKEARPDRHDSREPSRSAEQPSRQRKPERQPWEPRPPRQPRRGDDDDRRPQAVGMGDHIPAFMRKSVPKGQ